MCNTFTESTFSSYFLMRHIEFCLLQWLPGHKHYVKVLKTLDNISLSNISHVLPPVLLFHQVNTIFWPKRVIPEREIITADNLLGKFFFYKRSLKLWVWIKHVLLHFKIVLATKWLNILSFTYLEEHSSLAYLFWLRGSLCFGRLAHSNIWRVVIKTFSMKTCQLFTTGT